MNHEPSEGNEAKTAWLLIFCFRPHDKVGLHQQYYEGAELFSQKLKNAHMIDHTIIFHEYQRERLK